MAYLSLTRASTGGWDAIFAYRDVEADEETTQDALQWFEQHGVEFQIFSLTSTQYHLVKDLDPNLVLAIRIRWTGVLNLQLSE